MILYLFANSLYFDHAATTFCDPVVIQFMHDLYHKKLGNPNSQHVKGREAFLEIIKAQDILKDCVNGDHVIWTCDATQANAMAVQSIGGKVLTCSTEHYSLLKACPDAIILPVDGDGQINLEHLENRLKMQKIGMVSLMAVNNETGVQHPLGKIGALCHQYKVPFHVDATAAFGKIPIDMKALGINLLTIDGHKIYGPQGIGALITQGYTLKDTNNGTLPTVLCAGFGKAAQLACQRMTQDYQYAQQVKNLLWLALKKKYPQIQINGKSDWPYILNVRIPKQGKTNIILELAQDMIFSAGSACSTGKPSHVLTAMGVDLKNNHVIRLSFGRDNDLQSIKKMVRNF